MKKEQMKARFPGFKKCLAMMKKRDPQVQEDGFHWLLPHVGEHVHELLEEFGKENNIAVRCWLLELIGSARSPDAFDFLVRQLRAEDQRLRHWAIWALNTLDTKEARTVLRQARSFTFGSPEETKAFRSEVDAVLSKR